MCGPNAFSARTHAAANTTAVTAEVEYASDERRLVRRRVFREACDLKSSFKIVRRCGSGSLAGWSGGSAGRRMTRRRIVEETLIPGAKVTDVARHNGVAANLLHCWHLADVEGLLCARSRHSQNMIEWLSSFHWILLRDVFFSRLGSIHRSAAALLLHCRAARTEASVRGFSTAS
jgi:Transposase